MLNYNYEDIRKDVTRIYTAQQKVRKIQEECQAKMILYSTAFQQIGAMGSDRNWLYDLPREIKKKMYARELGLGSRCEKRLKLYIDILENYAEVLVRMGEMGLTPYYIHKEFRGPGNLLGHTLEDIEAGVSSIQLNDAATKALGIAH